MNDITDISRPGAKRRKRGGGNGGTTGTLSRKHEQLRSDGRPHDTGMVRPYRPCPADFRERYIAMGWDGISDHYHTNYRVIARWIEESGGEELRAARRERSGGTARPTLRSKRYVLGKTLSPRRGKRKG